MKPYQLLRHFIISIALMLSISTVQAQYATVIDNQDSLRKYLKMEQHTLFPEASSIMLFNVQEVDINQYSTDLFVDMAYKVFNAKDVEDMFDITLPWIKGSSKIKDLIATTYNLENGTIAEYKLSKSEREKEKIAGDMYALKFSVKNVKNGSVVRIRFKLSGPFEVNKFYFQKNIPILYCQFSAQNYNKDRHIEFQENVNVPFTKFQNLNEMLSSTLNAVSYSEGKNFYKKAIWIRRNVKELKVEEFSRKNIEGGDYISIQKSTPFFNHLSNKKRYSWDEENKGHYETDFKDAFAKHDFLDIVVDSLRSKETDTLKIVKRIYEFVNTEFKYIDGIRSFESVLKKKQGNIIELNMMLCALLRHSGIRSDIIQVSTNRDKPLRIDSVDYDRMNRVAVRAIVGNMSYFMDAGSEGLPFGYLPYRYYNGLTRVVNKEGGWIELDPIMAIDNNDTKVSFSPQANKPNAYLFEMEKTHGVYTSIDARKYHNDSAHLVTNYEKFLSGLYPNVTFSDVKVVLKNLDDISNRFILQLSANATFDSSASILFFDPYVAKIYDGKNPFLNIKDRENEIELDYYTKRKYTFSMKLQDEYAFEDLPLRKKIQYGNPAQIAFSHWVEDKRKDGEIKVIYTSENKPAAYAPEELEELKSFFDELIKTFNQRVLIKKN